MSNVINELIKELENSASIVEGMRSAYPGDSTGEMGVEAALYQLAAEHLKKVKWENEADFIRFRIPKVTVTYE